MLAAGEAIERSAGQLRDAFGNLPVAFVENRGQADQRVRYSAQGAGYAFHFMRDEVVMSLAGGPDAVTDPLLVGPSLDGVVLSLQFLGSNPGVVVEGTDRAQGEVSYLRGNDPARWHTALPVYSGVAYRELWPGIDLLLRGDAGELKYEFHLQPGARVSDIRLAYAGANGLALDHEGGLLVSTPLGELRDAPPISYQEAGGARVPVDSHYVTSGGGYGFAVGAGYRPDLPLVIDPGLDYSTFLGGSSHELAHDVAVDADGNAVVVGITQSNDFPTTPGAVDRTFNGGVMDVFVAKLDAAGAGLVYATYMGGTPAPLRRGSETPMDIARAVTVDASGNAYVTGQTTSPDFPTTSGSFQPAISTSDDVVTDAFVSKLSPTGSLVYSTFLGGSFWEDGRDIAVDSAGNAHVVGETSSDNFPTTAGAVQGSRAGNRDAFIAKLNASGSALLYSTYLGGASELDRADAVALDGSGSIHVSGSTRSVDFPTTAGSFQPEHSGGGFADLFEIFVAKLNPGTAGSGGLVYSTFLGTPRVDFANDLAVDSAGNAYVTGSVGLSSEFPTTPGAYDTSGTSSSKGFVTKLNPSGSALVYSTFFRVTNIALDGDGSAWLAGGTGPGAETTPDAFARDNSGGNDAYLARLNAAGSALEFATYLGGAQGDGATGIALGPNGSVLIAGNTMSADFPTTADAFDRTWAGDPLIFWGDAFVAKFSPDGGGDTTPPPASRETTTFTGQADRNQTVTHNLSIGATGEVDLDLDWSDSRADLSLRVRDPSGNSMFFDGTSAKPKRGTFTAAVTGTYRLEVTNTTRRRTGYTLSVTHPSGSSSTPPSGTLSSLSLSPTSVTGGTSSTGTVTLTLGAPPGGASVLLSSSNTAVATVPASVSVPATQTSTAFSVSTSSVSANTPVTISATYGGVTRTATLTVNPPDAGAVSSISLNPTVVQGGGTSTATVTLTGAAPSGGAPVNLSSSNTDVATVPSSVTVPAGSTSATFTVSTSPQQFNQSSAIAASYGGVTRSAILSVSAGTAPTLASLSLNPTTVAGGSSSTGTVTLSAAAPLGGLIVDLSSSNSGAAAVPATVTVGGGDTSASFTISTSSVSANTSSTISATGNGVTRTATLAVTAPSSTAALSTLTLSPNPVSGGSSTTGTVTLSEAAPSGGAAVTLISSNTAVATVPATVTVPAGQTTTTFTASTSTSPFDQSSAISASHGGVSRTVILSVTASSSSTAALSSLTVSPTSVTGGDSSTGTVTLTSAAPSGGASIAISSTNTAAATVLGTVSVPAGSTSATFLVSTSSVTSNTSSTITAAYAGATRTATLTVNAPAATTDTVTISRAEYNSSKRELRVEASSSGSGATLRAYVTATDALIGTLSGGRGEFSWPTNPQNVTVRSSLGGSASRNVTLK